MMDYELLLNTEKRCFFSSVCAGNLETYDG